MLISILFSINSLITLSIITIIGLYFYFTRNFNFWKSRGIDGPKPIIFFGTFYQIFFKSFYQVQLENSKKYGKIFGGFMGNTPSLTVSDPQIIKDICIKDFHIFVDRPQFLTGDPLNDSGLNNLLGEEWKRMRSIISPTFSSGKMRKMHPIIIDCVKKLEKVLDRKALNDEKNEFELKKMMSNLTIDVIASCAFGTRIGVYNEEVTDPFVKNAKIVLSFSFIKLIKFLILSTLPSFAKLFGIRSNDVSVSNFFMSAFRSIIKRRKSENRVYNDYLQLMLNAMNKTSDVEEPELESDKSDGIFNPSNIYFKNILKREITEIELMANSFTFFLAGYETTASVLSFVFYCLTVNEKCQQKLYEELKKFEGNFDYESIAQMPYLEACVAETLRLHNPLPVIGRINSEEYKIGDTGITIPKGTRIGMASHSIHHDPEYYPEPWKWDPERFMPENKDKLIPYTYMPFGLGSRNCVGMRFALMEVKTAIAYLNFRYKFIRTSNTKPLLTEPKRSLIILNYGDLNVGIELRNTLNLN